MRLTQSRLLRLLVLMSGLEKNRMERTPSKRDVIDNGPAPSALAKRTGEFLRLMPSRVPRARDVMHFAFCLSERRRRWYLSYNFACRLSRRRRRELLCIASPALAPSAKGVGMLRIACLLSSRAPMVRAIIHFGFPLSERRTRETVLYCFACSSTERGRRRHVAYYSACRFFRAPKTRARSV